MSPLFDGRGSYCSTIQTGKRQLTNNRPRNHVDVFDTLLAQGNLKHMYRHLSKSLWIVWSNSEPAERQRLKVYLVFRRTFVCDRQAQVSLQSQNQQASRIQLYRPAYFPVWYLDGLYSCRANSLLLREHKRLQISQVAFWKGHFVSSKWTAHRQVKLLLVDKHNSYHETFDTAWVWISNWPGAKYHARLWRVFSGPRPRPTFCQCTLARKICLWSSRPKLREHSHPCQELWVFDVLDRLIVSWQFPIRDAVQERVSHWPSRPFWIVLTRSGPRVAVH